MLNVGFSQASDKWELIVKASSSHPRKLATVLYIKPIETYISINDFNQLQLISFAPVANINKYFCIIFMYAHNIVVINASMTINFPYFK